MYFIGNLFLKNLHLFLKNLHLFLKNFPLFYYHLNKKNIL
jgi:hypothetical protein